MNRFVGVGHRKRVIDTDTFDAEVTHLYVDKLMTLVEISSKLDCSNATILGSLKRSNTPRRSVHQRGIAKRGGLYAKMPKGK